MTEIAQTRAVRLATVLGTIVLELPAGARLAADPGVSDGQMLAWTPAPELANFSVSHGPAGGRGAADLLALERSLATEVTVEADERDGDARELRLLVVTHVPGATVVTAAGDRSATAEGVRREHLRFRFWERGEQVLRAGYRLDDAADPALRTAFERMTDSLRLENA